MRHVQGCVSDMLVSATHGYRGYCDGVRPCAAENPTRTRRVVLPPPWIMLEHMHNHRRQVPGARRWEEYFDTTGWPALAEATDAGLEFQAGGAVHVKPSNNWSTAFFEPNDIKGILHSDANVVVVDFFYGHSKFKNESLMIFDCKFNQALRLPPWHYSPSALVRSYAARLHRSIGASFTFVHIRRGDILQTQPRWKAFTSIKYVSSALRRSASNVIVVATNEEDPRYMTGLRDALAPKRLWQEAELFGDDYSDDNFMRFGASLRPRAAPPRRPVLPVASSPRLSAPPRPAAPLRTLRASRCPPSSASPPLARVCLAPPRVRPSRVRPSRPRRPVQR